MVCEGWDGSDYEIYLYDGTTATQLTDNSYDDYFPQINANGYVVWEGWDGLDEEIFLAIFCFDNDGDGYGNPASTACTNPELDCDDTDPLVNPGATEGPYGNPICSDTVDNDCDTKVDGSDTGCFQCTAPAHCDDSNPCTNNDCITGYCVYTNSTDPCDDGDSCTMNDTCSGGVCSGTPLDADGDTYVSDACGSTDCDDTNPAVNRGTPEGPPGDPSCSDALDNDCDGLIDGEDPDCWQCTPSVTEACDTRLPGVCAVGTRTCQADGTWGACVQDVSSSPEVCDDGLDNDCDGDVDCDDQDCDCTACEPITGNECVDNACCVTKNVYSDPQGKLNHGMYVSCVSQTAKNCGLQGPTKGEVVSKAARSSVNK